MIGHSLLLALSILIGCFIGRYVSDWVDTLRSSPIIRKAVIISTLLILVFCITIIGAPLP